MAERDGAVMILGFGKLARRLAELLRGQGASITALVRRQDVAEQLRAEGVVPIVADLANPASLQGMDVANQQIYFLAPPSREDGHDHHMRHFLAAIAGQRPEKILYISTTAVYGNSHGDWVSEQSPTLPTTERGRRRLDAEQQLLAYGEAHSVPVVILRVGGIYGSDRLPLRQLQSARPVLNQADSGYTNRIHVDDLANICRIAMQRGLGIYNVSDGQPGTMADYFIALAEALGYPVPQRISLAEARQSMSAEMMSYLDESRRLDVSRMLGELGIELRYPDLQSGIAEIVSQRAA